MKYIAAILSILLGSTGQYFLKVGVTKFSNRFVQTSNIKFLAIEFFKNINLWIGLFSYGLSMVFWLYVLSQFELSKAYPLASLGYVVTMLLGTFLLGEPFNIFKITGLILIVTGVIFINQG